MKSDLFFAMKASISPTTRIHYVECYQAYADYRDIMQLLEDMISGVMLE